MKKESNIDTSVAGPSKAAIESSDTENDSSSDGRQPFKQAFRQAWLKGPEFQSDFNREAGASICTLQPLKNCSYSVKVAEIMSCIDVTEHNRSCASYTHFIKLLQRALPDSAILRHISLKKSKISAIIKKRKICPIIKK